jgi:hypothetical protein
MRRILFGVTFLIAAATLAQAGTIVFNTAGTQLNSSTAFIGQSFTTPGAAPAWNNITFNFYSNSPATTPTAPGTAFLLTQVYAGTPNNLSPATTGFVASAVGAGGVYTFAPGVTLTASTTYYLYSNASFAVNSLSGSSAAAGNYLFASSGTTNFTTTATATANFQVSGTATPEPTAFGLTGLGVALAVARRKRS